MTRSHLGIASAGMLVLAQAGVAGELAVVSTTPTGRSLSAPVAGSITVAFDAPVDPSTVILGQSFNVFGRWSGPAAGAITVLDGGATIEFEPSRPFSAGETVMVSLSHAVQDVDGNALRPGGYTWQFWTNARLNDFQLTQIDAVSTRTSPAVSSRAYGGIGSDLNGDGFLDLAVVNEDTADLRVFLNTADRSGLLGPFLEPTSPLDDRASPSEPADFNRDGFVDICVANINTNNVSILLGNGDGTFGSQQQVAVGIAPRGIAVLDFDGDGDADIANTNAGSGTVSLLQNDGSGVFSLLGSFDGGGTGEWGLAAADMDNDGILDLVVGAQTTRTIIVHHGNGDGTFSFVSSQASGGPVWMLAIGDLNGDGNEDVTSANSQFNRSSVLFGDGGGNLTVPLLYLGESFPIATDVGDLDGDGDLDWVTSSYGGNWRVYSNDGAGGLSLLDTIAAPQAGSCAVLMDLDNDGDLDASLIDEEEDVVLLMKNSGTANFVLDGDGDCHIALPDLQFMEACLAGPAICRPAACLVADADDDCDVDMQDFLEMQIRYTGESSTIRGCTP